MLPHEGPSFAPAPLPRKIHSQPALRRHSLRIEAHGLEDHLTIASCVSEGVVSLLLAAGRPIPAASGVILCAKIWVSEDTVGMGDALEALPCRCVARIHVGVVRLRSPQVCALDVLVSALARNPEHAVGIVGTWVATICCTCAEVPRGCNQSELWPCGAASRIRTSAP